MELKQLLKLLVETESPSHDKAAVDRVGALVAEEARKLGAQVEIIPNVETGNHVLARFQPSSFSPQPSILLLCHMDTVFPLGTIQKTPFHENGEKIFGPGTLDMKAGIVIALAAIEQAQKQGLNRPVTLLCTSDEEIGSHTSRTLIEQLAKESALALIMEGALLDGSLKTWRKGVGSRWVTVKGRAAHSGGAHQDGRNAIEEMAHLVLAIRKLTDYEKQTTVRYWPICVGATKALLLGPVMVDPQFSGKSYPELHGRKPGVALIEDTLKLAAREGHKVVLLKAACADLMPYYAQFGFTPLTAVRLPLVNGAEEAKLLMAVSLDQSLPVQRVRGAITGGWAAVAQPLAVVPVRRGLRAAPSMTSPKLRFVACG